MTHLLATSIRNRWRRIGAGVLVGLLAMVVFGFDLDREPHWVDESAIISKSYYLTLWLSGARDDPAWLEYPAFDHPPLGQYLTGLGLMAGGHRFPGRGVIYAWYRNTSIRGETPAALLAARRPSVVLGAVGCVAIFAIGTMARDSRVGVVAALLLMFDPLYRLHARRAIADVPCEAMLLVALAIGLYAWRETLAGRWGIGLALAGSLASGCFAGLAVLAKLNGVLALMSLGAWSVLAFVLPRFGLKRKVAIGASTVCAGAVAFGVFVAMNPTMTAHPRGSLPPNLIDVARVGVLGRVGSYGKQRVEVMDKARTDFPDDALTTPFDRLSAVAVQGFGRFGPMGPLHSDSTRRFDRRQDWGAAIWIPWVVLGLIWAGARGRSQLRDGVPPTAWAVLVQAIVALVVVTAFIPLAWDRYYLPIVAGCSTLAAGAAVSAFDLAATQWGGRGNP